MIKKTIMAQILLLSAGCVGVPTLEDKAVDGNAEAQAVLVPQDSGAPAPELAPNAGVGAPVNTPSMKDTLTQKLSSRGWVEGYDEERDRFVVIGIGVVRAPVGTAAYLDSRRFGWMSAMQQARLELVTFMTARDSTIVETLYEGPNVQEEINIQAAAVAGLQVVETYESTQPGAGNKTEIGIIAIYSAKSRQMSSALLGKAQPPTGKAKTTIQQWVDSLSVDQLLYTQGIQLRTDENGNVCLVAFAQAAPRTASQRSVNAARNKAYANGMGDLRDFVGTMVVVSSMDNAGAGAISSVGKSLSLPGVTRVRHWQAFHPLEKGRPMVGQVLVWNASSSEAVQALAKVLEANGGSFGGAGYEGSEEGADAASGTPAAAYDGSGVSGDDDDI
jgi:hypothetical protein